MLDSPVLDVEGGGCIECSTSTISGKTDLKSSWSEMHSENEFIFSFARQDAIKCLSGSKILGGGLKHRVNPPAACLVGKVTFSAHEEGNGVVNVVNPTVCHRNQTRKNRETIPTFFMGTF